MQISGVTPTAFVERVSPFNAEFKPWHIIKLNGKCKDVGGCQAGSSEEQWSRQDLQSHPAACTLAYWHEPRFSSGAAHGNDLDFIAFWQDLYSARATIVLNGHDHDYERFAPQDPDGKADPARGIREFVVGTGGNHERIFAASPEPNSEVRMTGMFGVLKLTLHAQLRLGIYPRSRQILPRFWKRQLPLIPAKPKITY